MKLTKCMLLMGVFMGGQSCMMSASNDRSVVRCENNSWYAYDVSFSIGNQLYRGEGPVRVHSGEKKDLNISLNEMQNIVRQFPDSFVVNAQHVPLVCAWTAAAAGIANKKMVFGQERGWGTDLSAADYVTKIDSAASQFSFVIHDATSPSIKYKITPLEK